MPQHRKLTPKLDPKSTKVLNLIVLQRIDSFIEEILMTAAHVTFYVFNVEDQQWSRKDVEGSLFVVKRNAQPRFQFIVLNQRNTENLVEDLLGDFDYEVQVPYLLYRNAARETNGIWFYNSHDCEAAANLFRRILNAYSKVPPKPKVSPAKSEFEEQEAVCSLSVIEGPNEPPPASVTTSIPDVAEDYFVNFNASVNLQNALNIATAGHPPLTSATIHISSHIPSAIPSVLPSIQFSLALPTPPLMPPLDTHESSIASGNRTVNLVKPSFFSHTLPSTLVMSPISSIPPPLHLPMTVQDPYGTPLLEPFPPPAPPASLAPATHYNPVITRDKVRDALMRLVQKMARCRIRRWDLQRHERKQDNSLAYGPIELFLFFI